MEEENFVLSGNLSLPLQTTEDHRGSAELLGPGHDHRDVPHQGPPRSLVSKLSLIITIHYNTPVRQEDADHQSYCDGQGNCLPPQLGRVVPLISYAANWLSYNLSMLDSIKPETSLEKLGDFHSFIMPPP